MVGGDGSLAAVPADPPSRLTRRLGTGDAVVVGLGAMVGAGVFAAIGPAAATAGWWLLVGLVLAAGVATANALSSAQLAAVHPESGGTYVYGRERLGEGWGFVAGWAFVVGKAASCAAMAWTFGAYVWPAGARWVGAAAVVVLAAVNLLGVARTLTATKVLLVPVFVALAAAVAGGVAGGLVGPASHGGVGAVSLREVLGSSGLLFFAFAGYARVATLGEEVRDPARTIPRAVPVALGVTFAVYAVVAVVALASVGPEVLAASAAPLVDVVRHGLPGLEPVVVVGAAVASLGVLLSLLVGVSRTTFAMADRRDLPLALAHVSERSGVPDRAEVAVAAVVVVVVLLVDLRGAIGASSFAVLVYYAIANASALRLRPDERRWPRWIPAAGLGGCVVVAVSLPLRSVLAGVALLEVGALVHFALRRLTRRHPDP
ncbi:MAG: APC family permease [Actinobacteria bacterium]|nr:APC family permease [Actinomycetota bacterium]